MNDNNNYNSTIDDMVQLLILEKEKGEKTNSKGGAFSLSFHSSEFWV